MNSSDTINEHLSTLEEIRVQFEPVEFFAEVFNEVISKLALNNDEVARASQWSPAMVSYVTNSKRLPSVDMLRRLIDGLYLEPYMMEVFRSALETHERLKYISGYIRSIEEELRTKRSDPNNPSPEAITDWFTKHQLIIDDLLNPYKRSVISPIATFQPLPQKLSEKVAIR